MLGMQKWGRNDIGLPWLRKELLVLMKERKLAPEVGVPVVVVAAEIVAGSRNLRRSRHFRSRGTSSPRASFRKFTEKNESNFKIKFSYLWQFEVHT